VEPSSIRQRLASANADHQSVTRTVIALPLN
jgi:hypothetical protein